MRTNFKLLLITLFVLLNFNKVFGQILHSENFAVIFDTSKTIKGNVIPNLQFQNLKADLFKFENNADITLKIKNGALTIANKMELSTFGKEILLSGGFLYLEYRSFLDNRFVLEPYSQLHWREVRGLQFKYAGGINLRYRIIRN